MPIRAVILVIALLIAAPAVAQSALEIEAKIPLGDVSGRIDHLAIDVANRRLFVAELGNDSVGVVDLAQRRVVQRLDKLREPQGVAWLPALDTLVVANANDGSVRFFSGTPLAQTGQLRLGDDADNVRVLTDTSVVVGYGSGALAVVDVATRTKRADVPLKAHPESFQIDPATQRAFVNLPDAHEIAVADLVAGRQTTRWTVPDVRSNFPMAWLTARGEVVSVFRSPPQLVRLRAADGAVVGTHQTCGDADDVFHDARRDRLYVTCGEGVVEILHPAASGYERLARVTTVSGARTGLFVPELDRLYVAVRARGREPAALWVFRPQ
jgi:hypothetical protein